MLINYFVFLREREDFELHPLEMKPNIIEIKIPKNSISKWNTHIQGDSVFKEKKKKKKGKLLEL